MKQSLLYPIDSASRRAVSLDGMWKFQFDPESVGLAQGWANGLPAPVSMPVPSSFCDLFTDKESREYCGDFWYETDFFVPGEWLGRDVTIRFGSATHRARVFVNGVEVAAHEGGFLPFNAEVSEIVRYNQYNKLAVLLNNELNEYMLPAGRTTTLANGRKMAAPYFDFYNYAGLQRPVKLLCLPGEQVVDFSVNHRLDGADAEVGQCTYPQLQVRETLWRLNWEVLDCALAKLRENEKAAMRNTLVYTAKVIFSTILERGCDTMLDPLVNQAKRRSI